MFTSILIVTAIAIGTILFFRYYLKASNSPSVPTPPPTPDFPEVTPEPTPDLPPPVTVDIGSETLIIESTPAVSTPEPTPTLDFPPMTTQENNNPAPEEVPAVVDAAVVNEAPAAEEAPVAKKKAGKKKAPTATKKKKG
jgi:hypothetical protein